MRNAVLLLLYVGWAFPAWSDPIVYVGGGIGMSEIDEVGNFKETDAAYRLFAGLEMPDVEMPHDLTLRVEIGYADVGAPDKNLDDLQFEVDVEQIDLYVGLARPFGDRWSMIGRIGLVSWERKARFFGQSIPNDGTDIGAGIGFEYRPPSSRISIRGELDILDYLDGVHLFLVSGVYRFGAD